MVSLACHGNWNKRTYVDTKRQGYWLRHFNRDRSAKINLLLTVSELLQYLINIPETQLLHCFINFTVFLELLES